MPRLLIVFLLLCLAGASWAPSTQAWIVYWDTDNSTAGNDATTGANLGGSGPWSAADSNWWHSSFQRFQGWVDGDEAVYCGTAGTVAASAVTVKNVAFRTDGYLLDSGVLTMAGVPSYFTVNPGMTATIGSAIAGTNTLVKLGAGTLVLANPANLNTANTVAGGWRIEGGGTLRIVADGSLGEPLPDTARNTVTDIQLNQSTIQAGASFDLSINRRTKLNTNASTNRGDAIIDTHGNVLRWFGSIQGGAGSLRVVNSGGFPGLLILGTDKTASVNPFGSALPAGAVNLTVQDGAIVQTAGTVTPTNGELGSETGADSAVLAIKLDNGQIRSESGGYFFQRNLILGPGGGSLDTGAWDQTFTGTVSGPGALTKEGGGTLTLDNPGATWLGGTRIHSGILQLGRGGSHGLLPGTLSKPSSVVISAGATLRFHRGSDKSFFDNISGEGGVTVANSPAAVVRLVSSNSYTGPTTISSGILMIGQGNPGDPGSIVSPVVNNSGTLVFNRVEDLLYKGAISGPGAVEKQAVGRLILTGTNSYTGPTTLSAGTLYVNGIMGRSIVTVSGGTLSGHGLIEGSVRIQSGGRLAPGTPVGTLTISNSLVLAGVALMELNAATGVSDLVSGLASVTYGGTLALTNVAGAITASHAFKLFSAQSYSGAFRAVTPASPGPGLAWNTNTLAADGTLRVSSIVSTVPVSIVHGNSGGFLMLSWPADHTGWRLQVQTNAASTGLGANWVDIPDASAIHEISFPLDPAVGSVFYRLLYP